MLSHLSKGGKVALLTGLLTFFLLIFSLFSILIMLPFMGTDFIRQLQNPDYSNAAFVNAMKVVQMVSMAGGLLLPAMLYLFLTEGHPGNKLFMKFRFRHLVMAVLLILIAQPFIGYIYGINAGMKLPAGLSGAEEWMKRMENEADTVTQAFLSTTGIPGFLVNVLMMAVLPAFCEEVLFRGVIAGLLRKMTGSILWSVLISSVIFAGVHMQFYGFLPRFFLGVILCLLYFKSGNLWIPVIMHMVNNLLSVVAEFLYRRGVTGISAEELGQTGNMYLVTGSLLVTVLGLYYLQFKQGRRQENAG